MAQVDLQRMLTEGLMQPTQQPIPSSYREGMLQQGAQYAQGLRRGIGAVTGTDTRTQPEIVQQQLKDLGPIDTSNKEQRAKLLSIVNSVDPVRAIALKNQFDERDKQEQLQQETLDIRKQEAEQRKKGLYSGDKKAIREATASARNEADKARTMIRLADDYERFEPVGGILGIGKDKWAEWTGSQGGIQTLRTEFNNLRNQVTLDNLPPGAASDKDVALALEGFPTSTYNAEELSSFLRGQAKLAAILSEREEARASYMADNDGLDSGFSDKWAKTLQEEDFAEKLANKHNLEWIPIETIDASTLTGVPGAGQTTQKEEDIGSKIQKATSRRGRRG